MESIQILNTAIIKSKVKNIDQAYEKKLQELCKSPALKALNKAISILSDEEKITRDRAAIMIIETIKDLDNVWNDYVVMEGIDRLKNILKSSDQAELKN